MNTSRRPMLLLMVATLTAGAGNGISIVAFPWLALQHNGSASDAAIVATAGTVPLLVATVLAGAAVDYLGRRRVSMLSDALSGLSVAMVPLLALGFGTGAVNVWTLSVLAALGAFFDPAGMTARISMVPEAAEATGWSLDRANSLYQANFNLAYIVGPGVGGLLIATLGGVQTMWVTTALFGVAIGAAALIRLAGAGRPDRAELQEKVWPGIVEGLKFVWSNPVLRTLAVVDLLLNGLYVPIESVLFPKYFTDLDQPQQLGWVLMALSAGGLLGALGYAVTSQYLNRRHTLIVAAVTLGVTTTVIAFLPPLPLILGLSFVVGLVFGPLGPIYNYVMQTRAPAHLRGRVVGVMSSLAYAAGPVGLIVVGPLADAAGLTVAFLALGAPMVLIGLVSIGLPALRDLDRTPQPL
ncbi:MFS transporter [Mycolicibacterium brumae]|uniref:Multidrug efflux pump Tap n=1 Tax=Mycolicibacterium brumae TaxID=85968 RepID=A0A2G5PAX1_9MYCO|nr:MFS transporter [Mycolicibacterium brumae]MCV7192136.1 MFS transporter [Mycolicibacterium brumae]PIB75407.1 MFS transporter [Mycolicibacterium brumae]RWA20801.1 hypothetical protein MBRU_03820 [Mycolicibacterium brumae DSM 44177]UWW07899.1 MFS transporter [Mycolicibacterium brumae]